MVGQPCRSGEVESIRGQIRGSGVSLSLSRLLTWWSGAEQFSRCCDRPQRRGCVHLIDTDTILRDGRMPMAQTSTILDRAVFLTSEFCGFVINICGPMSANSTMSLQVAGHGGVPTTGVSAVLVNITATGASAAGWLKTYTSGDPTPDGTSVIYEAGKDAANLAVVGVGSDGRIALSNSASLDVIIDVVGYYGETTDTWMYAYSPDGIRSTKSGPGTNTTYKWDRASGLPMLLSETTTNVGTTYYIYGPAGLPIEQINANGSVYFIHHDQLGSTRMITDVSGNAVATISYDAYGNERARSGTASSPFGFAGQYSDAESGFQYLRARYYDPTTGQFLTRDPIEAITRSAYGYVYGNPLNATDPSGLYPGEGFVKKAAETVDTTAKAIKGTATTLVGALDQPLAGCNDASIPFVRVARGVGSTLVGRASGTSGNPLADLKKQIDDYFNARPAHFDPGICVVVCYDHDFSNGMNNWGVGLALSLQLVTWNSDQLQSPKNCVWFKGIGYCWDDEGDSSVNLSVGVGVEILRHTF